MLILCFTLRCERLTPLLFTVVCQDPGTGNMGGSMHTARGWLSMHDLIPFFTLVNFQNHGNLTVFASFHNLKPAFLSLIMHLHAQGRIIRKKVSHVTPHS